VRDSVDDLVGRAARAGLAATLTWDGPRRLPPMVDLAAQRVVQEALTNAVKHAPGSAVRVRVASTGEATEIRVTNTLQSGHRRAAGGRVGLVGLRERVRLLGGTLHAGPGDHGYELVARLPHGEES
ncbi:MAG: ATP-binding protein, partial [Actinocatenispora sp.]